jgi:hypothetical protein
VLKAADNELVMVLCPTRPTVLMLCRCHVQIGA